ncbi:MAG: PhzF family phenazine biosynthesis isomerase [Candidatus Dadabacteria bacterium]|nr:PhzF family phenazine biosynthesis isomerase [Candidatus Dadabacteria bacterium]NIQ13829.1 PhzF family phenazine biosynthesis isomerase [Candidatus Dadabacteria bacterium]
MVNKSFYVVDAFADRPFSGNPAAVFILEKDISDDLKQKIATEINLSETAFVLRINEMFRLRWFTPTREVDLCGHATLASAHILWETGVLSENEEAVFDTRSGVLRARLNKNLIEMDFPRDRILQVECPEELTKTIPHKPIFVGKSSMDYLAVYENEDIIRNIEPDFQYIKKLDSRGLIITSKSSSDEIDFVSRFFAPNAGIMEDPVTGSAHCCLAAYWSRKLNKDNLTGFQASKRGGVVYTQLEDDKVLISGNAVTVIKSVVLI